MFKYFLIVLSAFNIIFCSLEAQGNSENVQKCANGGWMKLRTQDGAPFTNMGKCVSYGAQGGQYSSPRVIINSACISETLFTCDSGNLQETFQINVQDIKDLGFPSNTSGTQSLILLIGDGLSDEATYPNILTDPSGNATFSNSDVEFHYQFAGCIAPPKPFFNLTASFEASNISSSSEPFTTLASCTTP